MKSGKIGTVFLVSILAIAGIGISFAGLTDYIQVYGVVDTATVELAIDAYSGTWVWKVWGCPDAPAGEILITDDGSYDPGQDPQYAGCQTELVSWAKGRDWDPAIDPFAPNGDPYDAVVQFYNLFPCIDFKADIDFHYVGTIPAKIVEVQMWWQGEQTLLPDGTVGDWLAYLEANGLLTQSIGSSPLPVQIHYCDHLYYNVTIHLPQDNLFQGLTGTGYLSIEVIQWNDECDGTTEPKSQLINLPTFPVVMVVDHPWFLPPSMFKTTISGTGYAGPNNEYNVWDGDWVGWCVDETNGIVIGQPYDVTLYSSYDVNMPWYFQDPDWDIVNWIINHKADYEPYTWEQMQDAIWHFINGGYGGADPLVLQIIADAVANGEGYQPPAGGWIAVLCDAGPNVQFSFIEVDP